MDREMTCRTALRSGYSALVHCSQNTLYAYDRMDVARQYIMSGVNSMSSPCNAKHSQLFFHVVVVGEVTG